MSSYIGHGKAQVSPEGRGGLQQVISRQPQVLAVGQPLVIADVVGLVLTGRELGPEGFWGQAWCIWWWAWWWAPLVKSPAGMFLDVLYCMYLLHGSDFPVHSGWPLYAESWDASLCYEWQRGSTKKKRTLHKWIQPQEKRAKQILQVDFFKSHFTK